MKMFALAFLAVAACSASTVNCNQIIPDVQSLTVGNGCTEGSFTNQNFVVTHSPQFTDFVVSLLGADFNGGGENLHFGVNSNPGFIGPHDDSVWVHMTYEVTEANPWIDSVELHNIDGNGVVIFEYVCASSFADNWGECPTQDLLASIHASGGEDVTASFASTGDVFIRKDFIYGDASLTRFDNATGAPEPGTIGMIFGGGLLLLVGKRWKGGRNV